jgi:peptide/nickel transport system permease protein
LQRDERRCARTAASRHTGNQDGFAVTAYASLAFVGLGADPSKLDWGSMLFEYREFIVDHPGLMIWPGVAIAITIATLNIVFDAPN